MNGHKAINEWPQASGQEPKPPPDKCEISRPLNTIVSVIRSSIPSDYLLCNLRLFHDFFRMTSIVEIAIIFSCRISGIFCNYCCN